MKISDISVVEHRGIEIDCNYGRTVEEKEKYGGI